MPPDFLTRKSKSSNQWRKAECERLEKELANLADNILADERDTHTAATLESELFDELR